MQWLIPFAALGNMSASDGVEGSLERAGMQGSATAGRKAPQLPWLRLPSRNSGLSNSRSTRAISLLYRERLAISRLA